jgi:hypothetical protein
MRLDVSDIRLFREALRPGIMGEGTFVAAILGLGWLVIVAAFAR